MKKLFVFLIICFVCQSYQMEEDEEEFDPLEAMRRLWETEVAEAEIFRQQLRDEGVNVTEWEDVQKYIFNLLNTSHYLPMSCRAAACR